MEGCPISMGTVALAVNSPTQSTLVAELVLCTRVSTLHVSKSPTECSFWQMGSQEVTPNNGR